MAKIKVDAKLRADLHEIGVKARDLQTQLEKIVEENNCFDRNTPKGKNERLLRFFVEEGVIGLRHASNNLFLYGFDTIDKL
jgi:hypothetical protein